MSDPDYTQARSPRASCRFTVLLPVVRPPVMMAYAIRSVLAQTETDFELCVIGDGAPPETVAAALEIANSDPRVRVFTFPKGLRHGEAHRAAVLEGARSKFVAHIGDDDLWLPTNLRNVRRLLAKANFGSVPAFNVHTDHCLRYPEHGDLGLEPYRRRMVHENWNFFGMTEAAYRLSAYRALPDGWSPGHETPWSDLNMWRKFLRQPGLRFASGMQIGTLKFAAYFWKDLSLDVRAAANAALWQRMQDPALIIALQKAAPDLIAFGIGGHHLLALVKSNPARYLPLAWRRLTRRSPSPLPLV